MESPGKSLTFRFARASAGITLLATPAESMVGAIVSRIIAFQSGLTSDTTRCACSPRSGVSIERIHFAISSSSSGAMPSKYRRTIAVKCTGAEYVPIFAMAAAKCTTGLSFVGCDAWPEVPRAITATFADTFSLACTPMYWTLPFFMKTLPPSLMANPAANLSQYFAMSVRMLASPLPSSSAVARKITSRFRCALVRFR